MILVGVSLIFITDGEHSLTTGFKNLHRSTHFWSLAYATPLDLRVILVKLAAEITR